jgi:hypothetical protein
MGDIHGGIYDLSMDNNCCGTRRHWAYRYNINVHQLQIISGAWDIGFRSVPAATASPLSFFPASVPFEHQLHLRTPAGPKAMARASSFLLVMSLFIVVCASSAAAAQVSIDQCS